MTAPGYQDSSFFHPTWPEGTVARYRTVGGATVGVTQRPRFIDNDQLLDAIATCTGCGKHERFGYLDHEEHDAETVLDHNTDKARTWAQEHAEKCRAMPRAATT